MCSCFKNYIFSFKWITYLVIVLGVYTFLHWFLAIPLLYSHFHDCCDEKWDKNWIIWFLAISFFLWLIISLVVFLIWFCLGICTVKHINRSNVHLTDGKNLDVKKPESDVNNSSEKTGKVLNNSPNNNKKICDSSEILSLPEFNPKGSFTILQMNDSAPNETVSGSEIPIPLEESRHFVQDVEKKDEKPPKTPREIFFQDLIEAANKSESYFDFDPEKISEKLKKKYELEKNVEEEKENLEKTGKEEKNNKDGGKEENIFMGGHLEKENLTSEVLITLNEKGLKVDELGQFQVLKN